jgi:hypothetical protein
MVRPSAPPIREQAANSNFQHRRVDRGFQEEVTMLERIKGAP